MKSLCPCSDITALHICSAAVKHLICIILSLHLSIIIRINWTFLQYSYWLISISARHAAALNSLHYWSAGLLKPCWEHHPIRPFSHHKINSFCQREEKTCHIVAYKDEAENRWDDLEWFHFSPEIWLWFNTHFTHMFEGFGCSLVVFKGQKA